MKKSIIIILILLLLIFNILNLDFDQLGSFVPNKVAYLNIVSMVVLLVVYWFKGKK